MNNALKEIFIEMLISELQMASRCKYQNPFERYYHCIFCGGFAVEDLDLVINNTLQSPKLECKIVHSKDGSVLNEIHFPTDWKLITINADEIVSGVRFEGLPIVNADVAHYITDEAPQAEQDSVNALGYGILYIRGLNPQNAKKIPQNFTYSLMKSHYFQAHGEISRHWLVILGAETESGYDLPDWGARITPSILSSMLH